MAKRQFKTKKTKKIKPQSYRGFGELSVQTYVAEISRRSLLNDSETPIGYYQFKVELPPGKRYCSHNLTPVGFADYMAMKIANLRIYEIFGGFDHPSPDAVDAFLWRGSARTSLPYLRLSTDVFKGSSRFSMYQGADPDKALSDEQVANIKRHERTSYMRKY